MLETERSFETMYDFKKREMMIREKTYAWTPLRKTLGQKLQASGPRATWGNTIHFMRLCH
jgi:hypothetical protein